MLAIRCRLRPVSVALVEHKRTNAVSDHLCREYFPCPAQRLHPTVISAAPSQRRQVTVRLGSKTPQEVVAWISLRLLDQMVVHGNVMVGAAIIRHCRDEGVMLAFADANGVNPVVLDGNLEPTQSLLVQQVRREDDAAFGLSVSRTCVTGKLHNCRSVLRAFSRRCTHETVRRAIAVLDATQRWLERTDDLDVLRGHEG